MLSKILTGHSFYGSIRYVHQDESRATILATEGVRDHDYKLMIQDFELQHQLRPSKKQACFHGILSFYPGEDPGDKTMVEIAKKYLEEIGITDTQYVITKHTDKAHLHLHIIANMVDKNGNTIKDNWIGLRGKKAAQQLTEQYNLIPAVKKELALTTLEALSASEANRYRVYAAITESLPACRNMQELEAWLLKYGIETQYKFKSGTNEKEGVSFKIGEDRFKGSKVDRKFSLSNLEKTLALQHRQIAAQIHKPNWRYADSSGIIFCDKKDFNQEPPAQSESLLKILLNPEQTSQPEIEITRNFTRKRKKKQKRRLGH